MTAGNGGDPPAEPGATRPRLVIEWAGEGLAELDIRPEGKVSVAQLYAAAWLLDQWAREVRVGQAAAAGRPALVAAAPGLAAQLGLGRRS